MGEKGWISQPGQLVFFTIIFLSTPVLRRKTPQPAGTISATSRMKQKISKASCAPAPAHGFQSPPTHLCLKAASGTSKKKKLKLKGRRRITSTTRERRKTRSHKHHKPSDKESSEKVTE